MFYCEHKNIDKHINEHSWLNDFERFSSFGSVLFFSDFQCDQNIQLLLI